MKKLLPFFISVFIITFNTISANASDNVLRGVDVVKHKDSYTIELTTKLPAQYAKTIVSSNRVLINLKDINVSSNVSTKFDENPAVDSVMIEPCGDNNTNILVQGENVAYSDITFKQPTVLEQTSDSVMSSFNSLSSIMSGNSIKDKTVQFAIIGLFLIVMIGEIRFIKSKYDELKKEKTEMYKDIEETKSFQDYLPGYGSAGINKPYTTPLYGTQTQSNNIRTKYLKNLKTPETITLNSLLHNNYREPKIIEHIVHKKPAIETLSNININEILSGAKSVKSNVEIEAVESEITTEIENNITHTTVNKVVSTPIAKSGLKANLAHLKSLTALYRTSAKREKDEAIQKSLNEIF